MGAFCSLGGTIPELTEAIMAGRDGIDIVRRFSTAEFGARYAAMIPQDRREALMQRHPGLEPRIAMAVESGREAWNDANLGRYPSHRIALVFGICVGKFGDGPKSDDSDAATTHDLRLQDEVHEIARCLSIEGPAIAISTACASSAHAFGLARDILDHGFADAVMVGGTGDIPIEMFAGFYALGAMGPAPCAPYSIPQGLNLGEGAGCIVLERGNPRLPHVYGYLLGYGSSLDAYDATTPEPGGAGVAHAIARALHDAGIAAEEIGYVNSHGTGTSENDKSEWLGIRKALGDHALHIPVSSSKSFIGHTGAAAGILEAIITLTAMNQGVVPPTLHYSRPRRLAPADPVFSPMPRPALYSYAISCNSAFGGANAALAFGKNAHAPAIAPEGRRLFIKGVGSITPAGPDELMKSMETAEGLMQLPGSGSGRIEGRIPGEIGNISDDRTLDPVSRYSIAASMLALQNAGMRIHERPDAAIGMVGGVSRVPAASLREFRDSINQRGLIGLSSRAFSRIVMNAALGATAKHLGIHGPCSNIAAADGAGLLAVLAAIMVLEHDENTTDMFAVAMDEPGPGSRTEGAGCVIIGAGADGRSGKAPYIDGIGLAGPGNAETALRSALGGRGPAEIDAVFCGLDGTTATRRLFDQAIAGVWGAAGTSVPVIDCTPALGYAEAGSSMFAFILGVLALTRGLADPVRDRYGCTTRTLSNVMILSASQINASAAVLLTIG
jgi:3-oxoacyl-[acyl-carrier-protein] synthase II